MPRHVDAAQRKRAIVDASVRILAEGGYSALTLRSLARQMGGSITLITHYFQDREALISALLDQVIADADAVTDQLKSIDDPRTRLFEVLKFFLPITEATMQLERARVALTTQKDAVPAVADFFVRLEPGMRHVIEVALEGFIAPGDLEDTIDLLRAWTSGVVLVSIEHPEIWTPDRQLKALERFMSLLDLPVPGTAPGPRTAPSDAPADVPDPGAGDETAVVSTASSVEPRTPGGAAHMTSDPNETAAPFV